jgi:hypothetical protein
LQPSVASTMNFYEFLHEPLSLSAGTFFRENFSVVFIKEKEFRNKVTRIHLTAIVFAHHDEN